MAVRGVITDFFDTDSFEKQKATVTAGIKEYISLVDKAPTIKSGLNDNSKIKETIENTKKLSDLTEQTSRTAEKAASAVRQQAAGYEELTKKIVAAEVVTKEIKDQQKELESAYKSGKITQDEYITDMAKLKEVQTALNVSSAEARKELKALEVAQQSETGSINAARAAIKQLTYERDALNLTTPEGIAAAAELNDQIDKQNEIIKENVSLLEKQKINIGNYQGSAKIIVDAMEAARQKVTETSAAFGPLSPEAGQARKEFEALGRITGDQRFLNIAAKAGDTNKELRFMTQQLNVLEDAGLKNSEVYNQLRARLAQLTDQLADTKAEVKALSSDTRTFDLFAGSVAFAADTFQTFAGAAVLAGASEEDAAAATKTLVAVQSVANGVKGIANELTTKGTAANKAYNYVLAQSQILFGKGATAAMRFGVALKSIAILALIGLVYELAQKLNLFGDNSEDAAKQADKLTEAIKRQVDAVNELNSEIDFQNKLQIENLKQSGATKEAIYEEEQKARVEQLRNLERVEAASLRRRMDLQDRFNALVRAGLENSDFGKMLVDRLKEEKKVSDERSKATQSASRAIQLAEEQEQTRRVEAAKDAAKKLKDLSDKEKLDALNLAKFRLNLLKEQQQAIASNDLFNPSARILAQQKAAQAEADILKNQYEFDLSQKGLTASGKKLIDEKYTADTIAITQRLTTAQTKILYDALQKQRADRQSILDDAAAIEQKFADEEAARNIKAIETLAKKEQERLNVIKIGADGRITTLNKQRADDKISEEKYQEELKKIELDALKESLLAQIDYAEKLLKLTSLTTEERGNAEVKLADLRKQLSEAGLKDQETDFEKRMAQLNKELVTVKGYYEQVAGVISGALDAAATRQKNIIQDQIDQLDERTKKEIDAAEQSTLSEEKKADRIAVIQAKAEAQKQQYARRQREIDERKAKYDKAVAIASIGLNTAIAVSKFLSTGNVFAAIAAGIMGAAQLAIAIATPIPKYKEGTEDHPGGLAIVGDGNKAEGITLPNGTVLKSPSRATLVDLPKGTKVNKDYDQMLLNASHPKVPEYRSNTVNDLVEKAVDRSADKIVKAVKKIPQPIIQTEPRYKYMTREGHSFRAYLNNNL